MSILIWILIVFLVYSFVIVSVFMELALDKPKKTEDGKLRIRKNGWIIRCLYGANIARKEKEKCFPKNTCQLYKGICVGIPLFLFIPTFTFIFLGVIFVLLYGVAGPFAIILGYMPNPVGLLKSKNVPEPFYPYEKIGNKKWIAPWKFILPIGIIVFIYFFYREIFIGMVKIAHSLSSNVVLVIYGSIVGLIFLIIVINKTRKTESFAATKETVVSFVKKMCKEIEIT